MMPPKTAVSSSHFSKYNKQLLFGAPAEHHDSILVPKQMEEHWELPFYIAA